MFSVLILTLNEERSLPECLAAVAGCDDVVVLDSGSTDHTVEIAHAYGARVHHHPFENFAAQRNYAHRTIEFRHPWVFHLNADEQLTPELIAECNAAAAQSDYDGYRVAAKTVLAGQWIRHCGESSAGTARLVNVRTFTFVPDGEQAREAPHLRVGKLSSPYLQEIGDGDEAWVEEHQRHALQAALRRHQGQREVRWRDTLRGTRAERSHALRQLAYLLPGRVLSRLLYQLFFRGGIRDGLAGWRYCRLLARRERCAEAEFRRLKRIGL